MVFDFRHGVSEFLVFWNVTLASNLFHATRQKSEDLQLQPHGKRHGFLQELTG
jgi:hypothetical protein